MLLPALCAVIEHEPENLREPDDPGLEDQDFEGSTLVVAGAWEFVGVGWTTLGDAALAAENPTTPWSA